jgi:hypothetical protein
MFSFAVPRVVAVAPYVALISHPREVARLIEQGAGVGVK